MHAFRDQYCHPQLFRIELGLFKFHLLILISHLIVFVLTTCLTSYRIGPRRCFGLPWGWVADRWQCRMRGYESTACLLRHAKGDILG